MVPSVNSVAVTHTKITGTYTKNTIMVTQEKINVMVTHTKTNVTVAYSIMVALAKILVMTTTTTGTTKQSNLRDSTAGLGVATHDRTSTLLLCGAVGETSPLFKKLIWQKEEKHVPPDLSSVLLLRHRVLLGVQHEGQLEENAAEATASALLPVEVQ